LSLELADAHEALRKRLQAAGEGFIARIESLFRKPSPAASCPPDLIRRTQPALFFMDWKAQFCIGRFPGALNRSKRFADT